MKPVAAQLQIRRFLQRTLPTLAVLVLLFAALYLSADATRGVSGFSDYYLWVFALAGVALLVLAVAIGLRLARLIKQLRSEAPGSRLSLRLVLMFIALSLPPALIVHVKPAVDAAVEKLDRESVDDQRRRQRQRSQNQLHHREFRPLFKPRFRNRYRQRCR